MELYHDPLHHFHHFGALLYTVSEMVAMMACFVPVSRYFHWVVATWPFSSLFGATSRPESSSYHS